MWLAAVVSLSFLIRPLLELSLRPGPGLWGPGTPLVCPAPCTVACPEGHCSAGPGRWLVLPPLLPVVTIPTVPSGAARLPREGRGGSCRQESHLRPDGPHTRVRKRTGWGARRPQGLRPGLRGGSCGGLGGQRPAQPHPTRGPPCALLSPDAPLQRRREGVTRGGPSSSSTVLTRSLLPTSCPNALKLSVRCEMGIGRVQGKISVVVTPKSLLFRKETRERHRLAARWQAALPTGTRSRGIHASRARRGGREVPSVAPS